MSASNLLKLVFCLLVAVSGVTAWTTHTFELGSKTGDEYYTESGTIYPFSYNNKFEIPDIPDEILTGAKVIVDSLSTPHVTLDTATRTVSIIYVFPQWTHSNYKIIAKGIPAEKSLKTFFRGMI